MPLLLSCQSLKTSYTATSLKAKFLWAAVGNSTSAGFPYSATFASGFLTDSVMRSIAEQVNSNQTNVVSSGENARVTGMDAYAYRQQALNNAIQQVAGKNGCTENS